MAQGDPIARGTIEVGANTAPMEAALAGAKDKAVEQAQEIQQAVNTTVAAAPAATVSPQAAQAVQMAQRAQAAAIAEAANQTERLEKATVAQATAAEAASSTSRWQRMRAAINGANADIGELQKSLGVVGRVAGVAAALSAAVVGAYQLGQAIRQYVIAVLETGTEKAQKFKNTLDLSNVPESLARVRGELDQVNARLEAASSGSFGGFLSVLVGDTTTKLQQQRSELERLVVSLNKTKKAQDEYSESLGKQKDFETQIKALRLEIDKLNQSTFSRLEVSVEKIGAYVELLARRMGRDA